MVGRAHQHLRRVQRGRLAAQDQAQAQHQFLQPAQGAQGLGLVVDQELQALGQRCVVQGGDYGEVQHSITLKTIAICA